MIIDITTTELAPGNHGDDCLGNGRHKDVECCCDECNYMLCCISENFSRKCVSCEDLACPRKRP